MRPAALFFAGRFLAGAFFLAVAFCFVAFCFAAAFFFMDAVLVVFIMLGALAWQRQWRLLAIAGGWLGVGIGLHVIAMLGLHGHLSTVSSALKAQRMFNVLVNLRSNLTNMRGGLAVGLGGRARYR